MEINISSSFKRSYQIKRDVIGAIPYPRGRKKHILVCLWMDLCYIMASLNGELVKLLIQTIGNYFI